MGMMKQRRRHAVVALPTEREPRKRQAKPSRDREGAVRQEPWRYPNRL